MPLGAIFITDGGNYHHLHHEPKITGKGAIDHEPELWKNAIEPGRLAMTPRHVVAIVDDDLDISRALGKWLELHSLSATCHASGESLLQALHQEEGQLTLHADGSDGEVFRLVGAVIELNLPVLTQAPA